MSIRGTTINLRLGGGGVAVVDELGELRLNIRLGHKLDIGRVGGDTSLASIVVVAERRGRLAKGWRLTNRLGLNVRVVTSVVAHGRANTIIALEEMVSSV